MAFVSRPTRVPSEGGVADGHEFPHWRQGPEAALRRRLAAPLAGVLFDVAHNGFWLDVWGPRPPQPAAAMAAPSLSATLPG